MTEELFAYLMDDLPADRRAAVEAKLAARTSNKINAH
jgi:anti-sigma factor RsiW